MLSVAAPEANPTLNVRSPVTYFTPAFTTSPVYSAPDLSPAVDSPSAIPRAIVKSPVTALTPTCTPPGSLSIPVPSLEPSVVE